MTRGWTRRRVLRTAVLGAVAAAGCAARGPAILTDRQRRLRLVFYADVHARKDAGVIAAMSATADAIAGEHPDLILAGGDLIEAGVGTTETRARELWDLYGAMRERLPGPVHHALGNHDVAGRAAAIVRGDVDPRALAREKLGLERTYSAFDAGGYRFVLLDSVDLVGDRQDYRGWIGAEQLEWLRADVARTPRGRRFVVVTHMPLATGFFGAGDREITGPADRVVVNAREVLSVFSERRVVLVLQAHLHVAEGFRRENTLFLTGGAVCGRWWKGDHHGTPPGFAVVRLDGDDVSWRYVRGGSPR